MCVLQRFVVDLLVTACTGSVGALIEAVHCTGIFTQERVCCGWLWWQVGAIQARLKPGLEFVHLVDPADANVNATAAIAFRAQVSGSPALYLRPLFPTRNMHSSHAREPPTPCGRWI